MASFFFALELVARCSKDAEVLRFLRRFPVLGRKIEKEWADRTVEKEFLDSSRLLDV